MASQDDQSPNQSQGPSSPPTTVNKWPHSDVQQVFGKALRTAGEQTNDEWLTQLGQTHIATAAADVGVDDGPDISEPRPSRLNAHPSVAEEKSMKKSQIYSLLGVLWLILAEVSYRDTLTFLPYIAGTVGCVFLMLSWTSSAQD